MPVSDSTPPDHQTPGADAACPFVDGQSGGGPPPSEWVPVIYHELRRLAAQKMAHQAPGQTLQPTALVHEAWLRLGGETQPHWQNRGHFFAAAAEAMRRILIDSVRRKRRTKHGGDLQRVGIDEVALPLPIPDDELIALNDALDLLATVDARAAQVVKLRYFVGLTQEETAREMDVSLSTAERLWSFARVWLFEEMQKGSAGKNSS
jgi:RNA polymerase sigma factor (TIGR02999 family)